MFLSYFQKILLWIGPSALVGTSKNPRCIPAKQWIRVKLRKWSILKLRMPCFERQIWENMRFSKKETALSTFIVDTIRSFLSWISTIFKRKWADPLIGGGYVILHRGFSDRPTRALGPVQHGYFPKICKKNQKLPRIEEVGNSKQRKPRVARARMKKWMNCMVSSDTQNNIFNEKV